jgi:uroporphyrinogen decarboxylase
MLSEMTEQAQRWSEKYEQVLLCDVVGAGVFERAWYLRGFEKLMMELVLDPQFAAGFLEKILEHQLSGYDRLLRAIGRYIDGVWITDDLSTQDSLIVSPDLYRQLIKPYQRRLVEYLQQQEVSVVFHSCGAVAPLIPDLIDIGVRILHPVQLSARGMNAKQLKSEFGDDLVLWGGGCDSETLQQGKPEDVKEEVRRRIDIFAPGGGFIFTSTHCIQPRTPPENILVMIDTLLEHGGF